MILNDMSLYVHIPFCKRKCDYCDFFSVPCGIISDSYISALINEVEYYPSHYKIDNWKTIYIGGGTPSLLAPYQFSNLIAGIRKAAKTSNLKEFTVELNPDDITEELLDTLLENGVDRLSVGIQSLSDDALSSVHRRCSRETTLKALNLIHDKWNKKLSLDVIAGLPSLSLEQFVNGLKEVVSYNPDHISLYSLMLEEETPLYAAVNKGEVSYSEDLSDEQWMKGRELLEKYGYLQYEVSNFSKKGFEGQHNSGYWHLKNYIGCGSGATGTIYASLTSFENGVRWTDSKNINSYIDFWNDKNFINADISSLPRDVETIDVDIEKEEYCMMGLRLLSGLNNLDYYNRFNEDLESRLGVETGLFRNWINKGLAKIITNPDSSKNYALTKEGILFLNSFLEHL